MNKTVMMMIIDRHTNRLREASQEELTALRDEFPFSAMNTASFNNHPVPIEYLYETSKARDAGTTNGHFYCDQRILHVPQSLIDNAPPLPAPPTLRDLVARAGYYHHIDIDRLTADLRNEPGCENLQPRNLQNYLAGKTRIPAAVGIALSRLLGVDLETILRGSK